MKRAVYIGGFGNGRGSAERVADALGQRYEDVDPFTFVYAMEHPDRIRKAVKDADAFAHSAGIVALNNTKPECIGAIGAPLPVSPAKLVWRAVVKTARMHAPGIGIRSVRDIGCVIAYDLSAAGEAAAHGTENLAQLPKISKFNAVDAALAAEEAGIPVMLGYNHGDEFFRLSDAEEARARAGGVTVVRMPGLHDQLVLTPDEVIQQFLDVPAEAIGRLPENL